MASAIAYRGRDRRSTRTVGPCTLVHAAAWTTPEAALERQPQRHEARDIWLVADARIDNRAELVSQLRGRARHPLLTDADLILAAYECWGTDLVDRLVGDFAFAVWDGERNELLVARDPVGVRPVFFSANRGCVMAASTLPAVLANLERRPTLDEDYLVGYLAGEPPRDRSIWSRIQPLPPGHLLHVKQGSVSTRRYWDPPLDPLEQSLEATVEQVRAVFDEAVRCRLRTRDGVACELSGGFDSSTITATAVGLGADVAAVGLAFRAHPEADETRYQETAAAFFNIPLELIHADALPVLDPYRYTATHRLPLYAIDAVDTAARFDAAASLGRSVSLCGVGGDEIFLGENVGALDLAAQGHPVNAVRWAAQSGSSKGEALRCMTQALWREAGVGLLRRGAASRPNGRFALGVSRLRELRARAARPWLAEHPQAPLVPRPRRVTRSAATRKGFYIDAPWNPPVYELTDRLAAEHGVEVRYPFLDQRLIELGLRLPESQIMLGGARRGLHRAAFGSRLPPEVVMRTDKGDLSRPYMHKLLAAVNRDRAAAALEALGRRVDGAKLLAAYDRGLDAFEQPPGHPSGFDLWATLSAGIAVSLQKH